MKKRNFGILTIIAFAVLAAGIPASADDIQSGVGRISLIQGDVSTQRGDSGDWVAGTVNAPVVPGDRVSTGARSRAEIQLDYANILRLDQSTEAKIADLTRSRVQVQVGQGLVNFDVLKGSDAEAEIDTPNVAVRPLAKGRYRIEVSSGSETRIMVRDGQAEVSTPQGSTTVKKGELIIIEGADNPQYQVASAPGNDAWDDWNKDRDHTIADANSWRYTNGYYTGSDDLDRYGHWVQVPGYDYVWAPYARPGWVPYYDGRWVWEPYWGWTWVSYEPWGWAPYHYGRWFYWGSSWVWWPGPVYAAYRPVWAPAYVSFFGFGFGGSNWGFNLGFGFGSGFGYGSIGWLPIGPHDCYHPWYGHYGRSYNVVNVTNINNINNITNIRNIGGLPPLATARQPVMSNLNSVMNNVHVRQGITTVPTAQFGRGHIAASHQAVTPDMLKQGQAVVGGIPVAPTRASLSPVNRTVNPAALPHSNANQRFFTKAAPPAGPTPFAEQAAQVQRMIQQRPTTLGAPQQAGARGGINNSPATAAQARESTALQQGGQSSAAPSSGSEAGNPANIRSRTLGHQAAGQPSRAGGSSQTPAFDNAALNRLPDAGWSRFGSQSANGAAAPQSAASKPATESATKPQPGAAPKSATTPAPRTMAAPQSSWHRFGDGSQPSTNSPGGRSQSPRVSEPVQPRTSVPAQNNRSGFQSFSQTDRAKGSAAASGSFAPRSAAQGQGNWQRYNPQPQPAPAERNVQSFGARPGTANPSWERAPSRSETPAYRQPQGSYARPQLEIRKPIVTQRAPGGSSGGSRGSAPSGGSRGSSSSSSRSGGHGRR